MKTTKELIQELVHLSITTSRVKVITKINEIEVRFYDDGVGATYTQNAIYTYEDDANAKLKSAINKIKEL